MAVLNEKQKAFVKNIDGLHIVYAGPGTGKTETIKERYVEIIKKGNSPLDILLLTFTNNAANEMKNRIFETVKNIHSLKGFLTELVNAPISTFHSFCSDYIRKYGFEIPKYLGMTERISDTYRVLDQDAVEFIYFEKFLTNFISENAIYEKYFVPQKSEESIFKLIKKLSSLGIFPYVYKREKYWFGDDGKKIKGNVNELIKSANAVLSNESSKKVLAGKLKNIFKEKIFLRNAVRNVIDSSGEINSGIFYDILKTGEDKLFFEFVFDVYYKYMKYMLRMNVMSFNFLLIYMFVLLLNNSALAKDFKYKYIMIDEFQDTDEVQFKIAMLLSKSGNLSVIGDWKQSIYGFRNASVDNFIYFEDRLKKFKNELNAGKTRIKYNVDDVKKHYFDINYRSSKVIVNFFTEFENKSKMSLVDKEKKVMKNYYDIKKTGVFTINASSKEEEFLLILKKIEEIMQSEDKYIIFDRKKETYRKPKYSDIVILSRNQAFLYDLEKYANDNNYGIPMSFEGRINIYRTFPSIMLLAWFRLLLNKDVDRALAVIMEKEGYGYFDILSSQKSGHIPQNIDSFRKKISSEKDFLKLIAHIYGRYSKMSKIFETSIPDIIANNLYSVFLNVYFDLNGVVNFLERSIEQEVYVNVEPWEDVDSVKLQTIHGAKGLEYPIVFIANVNKRVFPSSIGRSDVYDFDDILGLRAYKEYVVFNDKGRKRAFVFDRFETNVMKNIKSVLKETDEEERLFYVASSRASQFLFITAYVPSDFFEWSLEIAKDMKMVDENIIVDENKMEDFNKRKLFEIAVGNIKNKVKIYMSKPVAKNIVIDNKGGYGKGVEFGTKIHRFAALYVNNVKIEPTCEDEINVKKLIDRYRKSGHKLNAEIDCFFPKDVANERIEKHVVIHGIIDLLVEKADTDEILIYDYKTDRSEFRNDEYKHQVSEYCRIIKSIYPEKIVKGYIFYTGLNKEVEVLKL